MTNEIFCDILVAVRVKVDDLTDLQIAKRVKLGFGQGEGPDYKPWLEVRNVSSKGRSCRMYNPKTRRMMTGLSKLEEGFCYSVSWFDDVVDIREQFPLFPRTETQEIAFKNGVKHPRVPKAKNDLVMTTDFLITSVDDSGNYVYKARYLKYESELKEKRVLEKFEIEKEYWLRRGIELKIFTEKMLKPIRVANISRLYCDYDFKLPAEANYSEKYIFNVLLDTILNRPELKLYNLCRANDLKFGFDNGTVWHYMNYLMARKIIPVNIDNKKIIGNAELRDFVEYKQLLKQYSQQGQYGYATGT